MGATRSGSEHDARDDDLVERLRETARELESSRPLDHSWPSPSVFTAVFVPLLLPPALPAPGAMGAVALVLGLVGGDAVGAVAPVGVRTGRRG